MLIFLSVVMCANPYHDIVESYPIDDIESDVLLNAPRLYSTAPKEEKDNEKRFLWNEWTQSNGFFQIMYERFHVPSLLHQEKHQVRNQLPDIEFHLGQNVFDRLLPVSLLEKIIDQISGKQIIYDKLEAETPDCIVLWRNQKFHLQFSNLKVQKLMITGLTRNMPYYVFDEGQEWKIGFKKQQKRRLFHKLFRKNRQPKNHFVGNRRQDLNRYLKMQGDKAQIAIRGLNFVLTGHSSISPLDGFFQSIYFHEAVVFYLRVKDAVLLLPVEMVKTNTSNGLTMNLTGEPEVHFGSSEIAVQLPPDPHLSFCRKQKKLCELFLKFIVSRSITKHKQTIAQVFGNMLKTEIPVWGELSSLVLDQIVTSHIAQYLRDSGLNPKSSKNPLYESQSNVPKKALISTPCPEEAKFGISDLVVHDLNWKIQNNLLNYSIRVDFIKQMVGDALQHRMLNYSTAWCQQKLEYKMESISKYLSYEPAPRDIYYSYDGPSITDEE